MEIKLDIEKENLAYKTDAQDEDKNAYHPEDVSAELKIAASENKLDVAFTFGHYLEHESEIKIEDFTFTLTNESAKYLHSFLTTFLKLNPK